MRGDVVTSAATARARARRQLQHGDAVPEIHSSRQTGRTSPRETSRDATREATRDATRPDLRIVPQPQAAAISHRSTLSKLSIFVVTLSVFIILVIVFQATIAEQQLRLDRVSNDLRMAETHYDNLRQQRAELLAPVRLREEAMMLGMYQGMTAKFVEVPADIVAAVMISTANMDPMFADPPAGIAAERALKMQAASPDATTDRAADDQSAQAASPTPAAAQTAPQPAPAVAPSRADRDINPIGNEAMMP
jgi:cell division protein FtsL